MRYESPLAVVAKGAIAGLAGTAAITVAMRRVPPLLQQAGALPAQSQQGEQPTETLAEKIAGGVLETPIDSDTKEAAGQAIHWSYGGVWGALYGIVQGSLRMPLPMGAMLLSGVISTVASTVVPAMRLTPPPNRQSPAQMAMMTGFQFIYGWTTALVFRLLAKQR